MDKTNLSALKERALRCELLTAAEVELVCGAAREVLAREPNVLTVSTPVTIAGDIHGQFHDLLQLLRTAGAGTSTSTKYLFLGDYVDRGRHSVEVITLLLLLKLERPGQVLLLRGNHEARQQTQVFGFYDECLLKYGDSQVWRAFTHTFDFLPVAAVVDRRLFCCHGGLSPLAPAVDDLRGEDRVRELPAAGPLCDLAWSDPDDSCAGWAPSPRGAGHLFGEDVLEAWNLTNGLELLVRGHQMVEDGFFWHHSRQTLTLFSAPNYMYRCGNTAAILEILPHVNNLHFKQFLASSNNEEAPNNSSVNPLCNKYFV